MVLTVETRHGDLVFVPENPNDRSCAGAASRARAQALGAAAAVPGSAEGSPPR
jgi:hypothetical protein